MKRKTIAFTTVGQAELLESDLRPPADDEVLAADPGAARREKALALGADGRLDMSKILSTVYAPRKAPAVYQTLAEHPHDFPVGAVFDWKQLS